MGEAYCCGVVQKIITLDLTTTREYISRKINFFSCKKCGYAWLFKEYIRRSDNELIVTNVTKRKEANEQFQQLKKQVRYKNKINSKKYSRYKKPDTAKGFLYYNNFKIKKFSNNHIVESFNPDAVIIKGKKIDTI